MPKKRISTPSVPMPRIAERYVSTAVMANGCLYISGQVPIKSDGQLELSSLESQTKQVMKNLAAIAESAGGSINDLVKVTIYLSNFDDFPAVNEIYASYFSGVPPARTTVEVSRLYKDVRVEMDAIAVIDG